MGEFARSQKVTWLKRTIVSSIRERCLLVLKNFGKIFQMGEGNDEKWVYSSVNFLGELTQSNKRFPKQKNLFCKLFTMGEGMCGPD